MGAKVSIGRVVKVSAAVGLVLLAVWWQRLSEGVGVSGEAGQVVAASVTSCGQVLILGALLPQMLLSALALGTTPAARVVRSFALACRVVLYVSSLLCLWPAVYVILHARQSLVLLVLAYQVRTLGEVAGEILGLALRVCLLNIGVLCLHSALRARKGSPATGTLLRPS